MMILILTLIATLVHFLIKWQWRSPSSVISIIPGGLSLARLDMYADNIILFLLSLALRHQIERLLILVVINELPIYRNW